LINFKRAAVHKSAQAGVSRRHYVVSTRYNLGES